MRTTLELDDELMKALLRRHPGVSKKEAVERAIRDHLREEAIENVIALAGRFPITDVSGDRRLDRR